MIKTVIRAAVLAGTMAIALPAMAADWQQGTHYKALDNPVRTDQANKIEVAEVFWYGCPHCYSFKPLAEEYENNAPDYVDYVRLPAALGKSWEPHAYAFYALQAMGELDKVHNALFEALVVERRQLNTPEALADFVAEHGVDADEFLKNYKSFGVNARMQQAQAKIRGARVTGTPTMLVNGKYIVSASTAGSPQAAIEVVKYLVAQEHGDGE
jgi:thiol:disulfide interchange protein DsbA